MDSNSSNLKRTLMDLRKMRRDVSIREEKDPEKVAQSLDTILKEAIALTTSEDSTMSKAAIKEIKQIRKGMMAGQINAGSQTSSYVGAFSAVLDQIDEVGRELDTKEKEEKSNSSVMDSLPSSNTIISAIMTANPIFGYTMKMGRDLVNSAKQKQEQRSKREKEEAKLRKDRLVKQESLIKQQIETDEMVRDNVSNQEDTKSTKDNRGYEVLLESIRDEILKISQFLRKDTEEEIERVYNEKQNELEEAFNNSNETLDKIYKADIKRDDNILQKANISESQEAEKNFETKNDDTQTINKGFLDDLMGGDGVTTLMMPFTKLFGFISGAGAILAGLVTAGGILASFKMIFDFVDGIFNAGKILGTDNIDWGDRIKVGVSSVISGLLGIIDSVAGFFGGDLMGDKSRDEWTKQYYDFFDNFTEDLMFNIKHIGNSVLDSFKTWISDGKNYITELASDVFSPILDIITSIRDYIQEKIYDLVPDFAKDLFGLSDDKSDEKTLRENINSINKQKDEMINIDDGYDNDKYNKNDINKSYIEDKSDFINNKSNNSLATSASEQYDNEYINNNNNKAGNTSIVAPSSNNTTINQSSYNGSSSSENREPSHRKMDNLNVMFASGLL